MFFYTDNAFFSYLQEWEAKAVEDRKRYEREFAEWKASGGQEAMDQVKNVIKTVLSSSLMKELSKLMFVPGE